MMNQLKFNYIVKGKHPFFQEINRRCITLSEAENVRDGLEAIEYKVEIELLNRTENDNPKIA